MSNSYKAILDDASKFCKDFLQECCQELMEFKNTGEIPRGGNFRLLVGIYNHLNTRDSIRMAENEINYQAVKMIAEKDQKLVGPPRVQLENIEDLEVGDVVIGKSSHDCFVITSVYGNDRATGVKTQDITNPSEWEVVDQ
jgi:hypothetical protein